MGPAGSHRLQFVREDGAKDRAEMASRTEGLCWWLWLVSLRLTVENSTQKTLVILAQPETTLTWLRLIAMPRAPSSLLDHV